jgi:hypothetical protein
MRRDKGSPTKKYLILCRVTQVQWLKSSALTCLLQVVDDEGSGR